MSADCCTLWSTSNIKGIVKVKSLEPRHQGNHFIWANFSQCANYIVTLFRDSTAALWGLDSVNGKHTNDTALTTIDFPKNAQIDMVECDGNIVVGASQQTPYLVVYQV